MAFGSYRRLPGGKRGLTGNPSLPSVVFWQRFGGGDLCAASCAPRSLWRWRSACPPCWVRAPTGGPEAEVAVPAAAASLGDGGRRRTDPVAWTVDGWPGMRLLEFITTNVPIPGGGER